MHPAPDPSLDLDPSKYKDQNNELSTVVVTTFSITLTHLDMSVCEKFSICDVKLLTEKGDGWAI